MNLSEYATYDATGIAALINSGQVSAEEIRGCALRVRDIRRRTMDRGQCWKII